MVLPINRETDNKTFYEFAEEFYLVSSLRSRATPKVSRSITRLAEPLEIPFYQRGIEWGEDEIEELVNTKSSLFGTVILALTNKSPKKLQLIDGLQRFATVTALLEILYPTVLAPRYTNKIAGKYFSTLRKITKDTIEVVQYNDNVLKSDYMREAVRKSYLKFRTEMKSYVKSELENKKKAEIFANKLTSMLKDKVIGVDVYKNFQNAAELTNSFIALNSTGVELSAVDLLRARLVEQALIRNWSEKDIQNMEEEFTKVFVPPSNKKHMRILGFTLVHALDKNPKTIFPNWKKLKKKDVENFLEFVNKTFEACKKHDEFPYLYEIFKCGGLPFTILTLYFYRFYFLKRKKPDFYIRSRNSNRRSNSRGMSSKHTCTKLLQVFYRKIIEGRIGRINPAAEMAATKKTISLDSLLKKINPETSGPVNGKPNKSWLEQQLRKAKTHEAQRIFNACLLPKRTEARTTFEPKKYGTAEGEWNIDHLIPQKKLKEDAPGGIEGQLLPNFSPLPFDLNISVKNTPCSKKLGNGVYSEASASSHPYVRWLANVHYPKYNGRSNSKKLDTQAELVHNPNPNSKAVGDERIKKITELLVSRI